MLTPAHHELLSIIDARVAESGVTPSYQELADAMDLKSRSVVYRMVCCLEERGYIRRLPNKARAIEVIRRPGDAPRGASASDERAAIVAMLEALKTNTQQIKLHMGELSAQELRAVRACLGLVAFKVSERDPNWAHKVLSQVEGGAQ